MTALRYVLADCVLNLTDKIIVLFFQRQHSNCFLHFSFYRRCILHKRFDPNVYQWGKWIPDLGFSDCSNSTKLSGEWQLECGRCCKFLARDLGDSCAYIFQVRSTVTTAVNMTVTQKVARSGGSPIPSPLPSLVSTSSIMTKGAAVGPYTLYSVSMSGVTATGNKYGVSSGSFSDTFKDLADLGSVCAASPPPASSSTSTSASSTKTSTSSSATPTLAIKPTVGAYTFQGCYTEGDGVRALTGAFSYNYTAMTLERCASACTGYSFWGVEYGGECYCGNTLAASSTLATLSDCSFVCPGNAYEYCGAGNRLELYLLSSLTLSRSSAATSTTSVSSVSQKSASSTSTKTSSSSAATQTLAIKQTVGAYTFQGCWTEATSARALSGATYIDYTAMTLEECASSCAGWNYFGVEYGGECTFPFS